MSGVVTVSIPGYAPGLAGQVRDTNDAGAVQAAPTAGAFRIPPVLWMFVFLVVGYVGLRMILED